MRPIADESAATTRIRLARAPLRLMALPAALALSGPLLVAVGGAAGGTAQLALLALGVALVILGLWLGLVVLSLRLEVELAELRLRWWGGERRYALARGPVTRVVLRGENASSLQPRIGLLGWALGPARLRGDERIEVVRLALTRSAIVVPTDRGRLAIAAASEEQLIAALTAAARVKQRLDEVTGRLADLDRVAPAQKSVGVPEAEPVPAPHVLTGIERQLLEERLAAERAAADAVETERQAAAAAATVPGSSQRVATTTDRARRRREPIRWTRPAWLRMRRPNIPLLIIAAPTLAAGVALVVAALSGGIEGRERMLTVALVLAGPASTAMAVAARAWWPRLVGLVIVTSLTALILVARALVS